MSAEFSEQHPLFKKYNRAWLSEVTGFSKSFLSLIATGKTPLRRSVIERFCYALKQPEEKLFLPQNKCEPPRVCGETVARLLERLSQFSRPELKIMELFADFLIEITGDPGPCKVTEQ